MNLRTHYQPDAPPPLFGGVTPPPPPAPPVAEYGEPEDNGSIDAAFERFHADHPEVYAEFLRLALMLLGRGHKWYSADGILHVVRFHTAVNPNHDAGFKINNNFSSRYARLLAQNDERFADFFEFRRLRSVGSEAA